MERVSRRPSLQTTYYQLRGGEDRDKYGICEHINKCVRETPTCIKIKGTTITNKNTRKNKRTKYNRQIERKKETTRERIQDKEEKEKRGQTDICPDLYTIWEETPPPIRGGITAERKILGE